MKLRMQAGERLQRPASSLLSPVLRVFALSPCLVIVGAGPAVSEQAVAPLPSTLTTLPSHPQSINRRPTASTVFRITGMVINAFTKSPIPKAELTISPMQSRAANGRTTGSGYQRGAGQTNSAVADATGHFEIDAPSAGGWSLTAAAHGYRSQPFDEHDGYSTAIILTEANPSYDVTFSLSPAAAIEGYVLDEAGEAVRNAQLTVSFIPSATPEDTGPRRQSRGNQRTDDRGYYKVQGLLAGNYEVRLQAQPWYATTGPRSDRLSIGVGAESGSTASTVDSSSTSRADPLDVVYPTLWYPGVADFAAATPIAIHAGETREADFRLSPVPGFHLRIAAARSPEGEGRRPAIQSSAYLTQILPDGTESGVPVGMHTDVHGNSEFSGIAPGTYVVHRQGESSTANTAATIQISPNSSRTVDLSQAVPATTVGIKIDPAGDLPSLQISCRDLETGRVSYAQGSQSFGTGGARRRQAGRATPASDGSHSEQSADRSINLQPGRYEVALSGINELHLTSIEANGARAIGRTITVAGGSPSIVLHVAAGRANVSGFVRTHGAAMAGAMVLLIPATLGEPAGLDIIRRDQSNSDGSFDMLDVLPGAYILVAVEHGWETNWHDPATLRHFLLRGVPLDLNSPGDRKQDIEAQSP